MVEKGLTGCTESVRLLVGHNPDWGITKNQKVKVEFDGAFGEENIERLKFPTWRHCVAYGLIAENMRGAMKGSLIKVFGWLETEGVKDMAGQPIVEDGGYKKREVIVCLEIKQLNKADYLKKQSNQLFGFEGSQESGSDKTNPI
jgi:hypothetical protein